MNHTIFLLGQYHSRQRLAELGFQSSMDDLDAVTAEVFITISNTYSAIESEQAEKNKTRGRR